jgi:hypothetical protein
MAAHTLSDALSHANSRDLNQTELNTLEVLIDAAGIEAVIQGLSEICGLKADHIAHSWQDTTLARNVGRRWKGRWVWRPQRQQGSERRTQTSLHAREQAPHAGSNLNHWKVEPNQ